MSVDNGRADVLVAKQFLDGPNVVSTFEQMRKRSRSVGLRVPFAGCWALFGTLGPRLAGPDAMTSFCLLLLEEMTFMVRRPCLSGRNGCAQFQGYVSPIRIVESQNLSRCFRCRGIERKSRTADQIPLPFFSSRPRTRALRQVREKKSPPIGRTSPGLSRDIVVLEKACAARQRPPVPALALLQQGPLV